MSRHLVTTTAVAGMCPGCREPVLTGISEGLTVRADPYPLTRDLEVAMIIAGRDTYTLTFAKTLVRRLGNTLMSGFALPEHKCGFVIRVPAPPAPPRPDLRSPPYS